MRQLASNNMYCFKCSFSPWSPSSRIFDSNSHFNKQRPWLVSVWAWLEGGGDKDKVNKVQNPNPNPNPTSKKANPQYTKDTHPCDMWLLLATKIDRRRCQRSTTAVLESRIRIWILFCRTPARTRKCNAFVDSPGLVTPCLPLWQQPPRPASSCPPCIRRPCRRVKRRVIMAAS